MSKREDAKEILKSLGLPVLLYLGDTAHRRLVVASKTLNALHIADMNHDKLPDVVLYDQRRKWLYLIEAVTTHGPVSPKRHAELEAMLKDCSARRVYVTAFVSFTGFKKYASEIVWESEVWIAEFPDHMIHFNGDMFLGPYPPKRMTMNSPFTQNRLPTHYSGTAFEEAGPRSGL